MLDTAQWSGRLIQKLSIVLTTHNRVDLLPQGVETVLSQGFSNFELLIVDDGSTDSTREVLPQITAKDNRIRVVSHEHSRGLSAARNTGIREACGDALAFLDDDDLWYPDKLKRQVHLLNKSPDTCGLIYCWFEYFSASTGQVIEVRKPSLSGEVFAKTIERQPLGNGSTFLIPKHVFNSVSGFDETLKRGIDGDFVRRLARQFNVNFVPETLARLRVDHGHGRITNDSHKGIFNALNGHYRKLDVFPDLENEYPNETAGLYSTISAHHLILGQWREAMSTFSKAVSLAPFSKKPYAPAFKTTLSHIWRRLR